MTPRSFRPRTSRLVAVIGAAAVTPLIAAAPAYAWAMGGNTGPTGGSDHSVSHGGNGKGASDHDGDAHHTQPGSGTCSSCRAGGGH
jgi:hypothetical protein